MTHDFIERRETGFYVVGSRVPIDSIVWEYRHGEDPEAIQSHYPTLSLDEVNGAIAEAEKKPDPPREGLFEDVYSNLPWFLREQRDEMLATPPVPRPDAKKIAGR